MSRLSLQDLDVELADRWDNLLMVQDLDGVCMPLVRDPLQRSLQPSYVKAAAQLGDHFRVLTNGEHSGRLGVNRLVEAALAPELDPARSGHYLPGLAAGGVQLQDRFGSLSHPGVSDAEMTLLRSLPERMEAELQELVSTVLPGLPPRQRRTMVRRCVLDNALSPTLNINPLVQMLRDERSILRKLQEGCHQLLQGLMREAGQRGLQGSFFIHLAPNLGSHNGEERLRHADGERVGTTDFQFMLRGSIKEAGLLVLINQHIERRTGHAPLGADFNARSAPKDLSELLSLAQDKIPLDQMPTLIGVGDTITSEPNPAGHGWLRGGSDRGFLQLVQELGRRFGLCNRVLLVDSSGGELDRPSLQDPALTGITDPDDPLRPNVLVHGGPAAYCQWFEQIARGHQLP